MKTRTILSILLLGALMLACNVAPGGAAYTGRRCTSNVHCASNEVCWTYDVSTTSFPERGASVVRDGYCGKLEADK